MLLSIAEQRRWVEKYIIARNAKLIIILIIPAKTGTVLNVEVANQRNGLKNR